jgi:hypothetical protein
VFNVLNFHSFQDSEALLDEFATVAQSKPDNAWQKQAPPPPRQRVTTRKRTRLNLPQFYLWCKRDLPDQGIATLISLMPNRVIDAADGHSNNLVLFRWKRLKFNDKETIYEKSVETGKTARSSRPPPPSSFTCPRRSARAAGQPLADRPD